MADSRRTNGRAGNGPARNKAPEKAKGDRPYAVARLGAYKISCWKNKSENGHFYSCTLKRVYKVGDEWKETDKVNHSDLLIIAQLCQHAFANLMMDDGKLRYEPLESSGDNQGGEGESEGEEDRGDNPDSY